MELIDIHTVPSPHPIDMFKMFAQYGEKISKGTVSSKSSSNIAQSGKKREPPKSHDYDAPKSKEPRPRATDMKNSNRTNKPDDVVVANSTLQCTQDSTLQCTQDRVTKSTSDAKKYSQRKVAAGNKIAALVNSTDPFSFVQNRVSKDFDGVTFFGTVVKYDDSDDPAFWHVVYDDGDAEDYNKKDLIKALKHYGVNGMNDAHRTN